MQYSVCSYSFHRTFAAGKMDIFDYITWCKDKGFTQLDPWMEHLMDGFENDAFIARVKDAGDAVALPFGCIAVDGAHIYEATAVARSANRQKAYRWLDIGAQLGARQVRLDAGGQEESLEEIWDSVVAGYQDVIAYARERGIEVLIENHWGPTKHPDNLYKLLDRVDGLGLLFDSGNWPQGTHEQAWPQYAPYARLTHIKTYTFDEQGNEPQWDIPQVIRWLREASYDGCWGIEAVARDGDEMGGVLKTLALIQRELGLIRN
jgi:sugar phosphate isomerase/epimerase